jgi:enoyl-CoA hydratase
VIATVGPTTPGAAGRAASAGLRAETVDSGLLLLTIDRPARGNALSLDLLAALEQVMVHADGEPDVRVVVITGSGDRIFSAGADIEDLDGLDHAAGRALAERGQRAFRSIEWCAKPVIAALNGTALGGGLELALACDFRIAAAHVLLGQPEITLANIPGWGATHRLPEQVGRGRATALILTGNTIDADHAERIGLVNTVVPGDALRPTTLELAGRLRELDPLALQMAKAALATGRQDGPGAGALAEAAGVAACSGRPAQRAAIQAFRARRTVTRRPEQPTSDSAAEPPTRSLFADRTT